VFRFKALLRCRIWPEACVYEEPELDDYNGLTLSELEAKVVDRPVSGYHQIAIAITWSVGYALLFVNEFNVRKVEKHVRTQRQFLPRKTRLNIVGICQQIRRECQSP
jgi:hypothetical protein